MTIEATQRKAMTAGQTLTAKYKGIEYTAVVVAGEGGKLLYRLADGREFKSPSSAGSAVMDGVACNGWRFWSVAGASTTTKPEKQTAPKPARLKCDACGKSFVAEKQLGHHRANAERLCHPA